MPVRTDEEVREALEAQAHDNANAGELLDILRWSPSGNAAQKRARLLSFLDGPASRRMRAAISAGDAVDAVLSRASVSLKVFKIYYDLPAGGASAGGVESLDGKAAANLLIGLQPQSEPEPVSAPLLLEDG